MGMLFGMIKVVLLLAAFITIVVFLVIGIYAIWIAKENPDVVKRFFAATMGVFVDAAEEIVGSIRRRLAKWRSSFRPFPRYRPHTG